MNTIMHIYGDPTAVRTNDCIQQLITVKDTLQFDIDKCLDDENVMKDNDDKMELDSVDELLHSSDAIIHQSPFNTEMRKRISLMDKHLNKSTKFNNITNSNFSRRIVLLYYRWFAYLPLFSCLLSDFKERYAKDKQVTVTDKTLGRARLSNAVAESYFQIIKESILQNKRRLRPVDALIKINQSTLARLKAGRYGVSQKASTRKARPVDVLILEVWRKRRTQVRRSKSDDTLQHKTKKNSLDSLTDSHLSEDHNLSINSESDNSWNYSNNNVSCNNNININNVLNIDDNDEILNTSVKSNDNQLPPLLNDHESEMNFNDTAMKDETRRSLRQCTIPKQYNDYDMPARSSSTSALSPKRTASSLTVTSLSNCSSSDNSLNHKPRPPPTKKNQKRQKIKESPKQWLKSEHPCTALIEKVTIPWPKYSIKNAIFNGTKYSVINT
ncbi:unnamed protein product, partial [Didymodactylos carnosus]